jgi:hypothetical protein
LSKHNGDSKINPHDIAAARIVQGALEAAKLPPAAARAVFRAMGAAGAEPPLDVKIDPKEPPQPRPLHLIPGYVGVDQNRTTTVCESCFPGWQSVEVLTIPALLPCEKCGSEGARHVFRRSAMEPGMVLPDPDVQRAARRIEAHQEALVLGLVRERMELDSIEIRDLEPGELQGFDYLPTTIAPGYREYELLGKPMVRFYSPEVAFDGQYMLVNLRYRVAV